MKQKFLIFILALSMFGCVRNETTFIIRNQTTDTIKDVFLQNHQRKNSIGNIAPSAELSIKLPLERNDSIVRDGEYLLHYRHNGKNKIGNFGYYTNNTVQHKNYMVLFKNDTILISQE